MKEKVKKNKGNHTNTVYSAFAVLFYINRQKKSGMCPLMGRISINAEVAQFSAGINIDPSLWDAKAYRMTRKSRHAAKTNYLLFSRKIEGRRGKKICPRMFFFVMC